MARPHPPELRQHAIELAQSSDEPLSKVAERVGVAPSTLRSWVRAAKQDQNGESATADAVSNTSDVVAEVGVQELPDRDDELADEESADEHAHGDQFDASDDMTDVAGDRFDPVAAMAADLANRDDETAPGPIDVEATVLDSASGIDSASDDVPTGGGFLDLVDQIAGGAAADDQPAQRVDDAFERSLAQTYETAAPDTHDAPGDAELDDGQTVESGTPEIETPETGFSDTVAVEADAALVDMFGGDAVVEGASDVLDETADFVHDDVAAAAVDESTDDPWQRIRQAAARAEVEAETVVEQAPEVETSEVETSEVETSEVEPDVADSDDESAPAPAPEPAPVLTGPATLPTTVNPAPVPAVAAATAPPSPPRMSAFLIVALSALIALLIGLLAAGQQEQRYESDVRLLVGPITGSRPTLDASGLLASTYADLLSSRFVIERAETEFGISIDPDTISAIPDQRSRIILLTVEADEPDVASERALTIALSLVALVNENQSGDAEADQAGLLTVLDPPSEPEEGRDYGLLITVASLVIGVGVGLFLVRRTRSEATAEAALDG